MSSTWCSAARFRRSHAKLKMDLSQLFCTGIEREVEVQNIHPWLAQKTEIATVRILPDQFAHFVDVQSAGPCHTRNLQFGILHADVRIETAARRRNSVGGNLVGFPQTILGTIRRDA